MIFLELFLTFLKIGAFTFGGGFAMLPFVQEAVLQKGWMTSGEILDFIAVSESTPGPFAINISTFVGTKMGGVLGAACATLGVVVPSFVIILIVAKFYEKFKSSKTVSGVMSVLKPAAIGLILGAVVTVGSAVFFPAGLTFKVFETLSFYVSLVIFAAALIMSFKKVHPIIIICISAVLGIASGYLL